MPTKIEWLEKATVFDLGICSIYNRPIRIEARDQINGERLWVFKMNEWVLGKDKHFHYEPIPSSRTDKFILLTRFHSVNACYEFWKKNIIKKESLYI